MSGRRIEAAGWSRRSYWGGWNSCYSVDHPGPVGIADDLRSYDEPSGLTRQYISDLERGKYNPTIVTVYELAQALGASQVELVRPD